LLLFFFIKKEYPTYASGNLSSKEKCKHIHLHERNRILNLLEVFLKKYYIKFSSLIKKMFNLKKKRDNHPYDWKLLLSNLVAEVFVVDEKP
jgi:hypothetical protein